MAEIEREIRNLADGKERHDGRGKGQEGAAERYPGRSQEESLLTDFARHGIYDPDMPFRLYFWEARSVLEGSFLRDVDMRRDLMELAVNIANVQNAKNPKRSVKTGYKNIDKAEQKIINRNGNGTVRKPDVEMIRKLNAAFGGGS